MISASPTEYRKIVRACRKLPPPKGNYHDHDFVSNLVQTVLDYRMQSQVLDKAYKHFEYHHWDDLRTQRQLTRFLSTFPDTNGGNRAGATALWGYRYGRRFRQLRRLVSYFRKVGVTDQETLTRWARESSFEADFKGKVKGLGFAVYKWLQMRVGVQTVKPDAHVKNFLRRAAGRQFRDEEAVSVLERVAKDVGWKAYHLDWAIWESEKARQHR